MSGDPVLEECTKNSITHAGIKNVPNSKEGLYKSTIIPIVPFLDSIKKYNLYINVNLVQSYSFLENYYTVN